MKILYISASNMVSVKSQAGTSFSMCEIVKNTLYSRGVDAEHSIIENVGDHITV